MTSAPYPGSPAGDSPGDEPAGGRTTPGWGARLRRVPVRVWVALALGALAIAFIAQNRDRVTIDLAGYSVSAPLWLLSGTLLALGILIGALLSRRAHRRSGT